MGVKYEKQKHHTVVAKQPCPMEFFNFEITKLGKYREKPYFIGLQHHLWSQNIKSTTHSADDALLLFIRRNAYFLLSKIISA